MGGETSEAPEHQPYAAILSCSDARVPTELIFHQMLNDLFVVRLVIKKVARSCLEDGPVRLVEIGQRATAHPLPDGMAWYCRRTQGDEQRTGEQSFERLG